MTKNMSSFETKKILTVIWCVASALLIAAGIFFILFAIMQVAFSMIPSEFWHTLVDEPSSEKLQPIMDFLKGINREWSTGQAIGSLILWAVLLAACIISLIVARKMLQKLERSFKRTFLPDVLAQKFSDVAYDPDKHRSEDEPLCRLGLLRYYERYYTANRLEAMYRDCWVASEEVICGGVYGQKYTGHKIKVRGQWMTVRLSQRLASPVILEKRHTKNRLTHAKISDTMREVKFSYDRFSEQFRCFAEDPDLAQMLITRQFAEQLLGMLDTYGDFCVLFDGSNMHVLLRRKSFDRRLECLVPYSEKLLQKEATRLYQPLQDFTDLLLE